MIDGAKERKKNWEGVLLICCKCKNAKPVKSFGNDYKNRCRNHKSNYCTECANEISRIRTQKKYSSNDLDFYLGRLQAGLKSRVIGNKSKGKYDQEIFDITKEGLYQLYNQQNGICILSGIKMTYSSGNGLLHENISIDKINPSQDYTMNNIQLVCYIANAMKSNLTIEQMVKYCKAVIEWQNIK